MKILALAATWMGLEGIMLSEISQTFRQRKTNTKYYHLYVESEKLKLVNITNKNQTHKYREQTNGYQWKGRGAT